ncbi:hypothetical protein DSO57_1015891 [Entomophthora muscae]|uniref:Uncharacterized protein n=1 Tax=Entomophthora muscae TaxID=34485 RepID=A0ACC2S6Z3_9FUNG|nr:hypothetical protein DSO57_1015891 [Entomophthora muscae]
MDGDIFQMGGTFVVNRKGKILYSFHQKDFASFSSPSVILDICRLNLIQVPLQTITYYEPLDIQSDLDAEEVISIASIDS